MENPSDPIGNRIHDRPVSSAVPQLTAPTRTLQSLRFPNHIYLRIFHFPSACRMSCPSQPTIWLIWLIFISSFFRRPIAFSFYGLAIHFCTLFLNTLNFINERPNVAPIHNKYDCKSLKTVDIKIGSTPCSLLRFRRSILSPSSVLKLSLFYLRAQVFFKRDCQPDYKALLPILK
jgi:hypothetical protein